MSEPPPFSSLTPGPGSIVYTASEPMIGARSYDLLAHRPRCPECRSKALHRAVTFHRYPAGSADQVTLKCAACHGMFTVVDVEGLEYR